MTSQQREDRCPPETVNLLAGDISLDFANTAEWHAGPSPEERLISYSSALAWSQHAGILSDAQVRSLLARARARPPQEGEALGRVIALREAVYRIFAGVGHHRSADPADLQILNAELAEALAHLRLVAPPRTAATGEVSGEPGDLQQFAWTWTGVEDDLTSLLWPVARAAALLLTSPQLTRVRECAGDPCGWLFLDLSRNGSRRWCDMADCGNRAKARRYRARRKGDLGVGQASE
jgi:predicted RNA-binding Zn ribbon-like protein